MTFEKFLKGLLQIFEFRTFNEYGAGFCKITPSRKRSSLDFVFPEFPTSNEYRELAFAKSPLAEKGHL